MKKFLYLILLFCFLISECFSIGIGGPQALFFNSINLGINYNKLNQLTIDGKNYFNSKTILLDGDFSYNFNYLISLNSYDYSDRVIFEQFDKVIFRNYFTFGMNYSFNNLNNNYYYDSIPSLKNNIEKKSISNLKISGYINKFSIKLGKSYFINSNFEICNSLNYNFQWGKMDKNLVLENSDYSFKVDSNFIYSQNNKEIILPSLNFYKNLFDIEISLKYHYFLNKSRVYKSNENEEGLDGNEGWDCYIAFYKRSLSIEAGLIYQLNQIDEIKPFSFGFKLGYNF